MTFKQTKAKIETLLNAPMPYNPEDLGLHEMTAEEWRSLLERYVFKVQDQEEQSFAA